MREVVSEIRKLEGLIADAIHEGRVAAGNLSICFIRREFIFRKCDA